MNGAAISDPMPSGGAPDKSDRALLESPLSQQRRWNVFGCHRKGEGGRRLYGMGAAAGDFDNDGHTDLYVTNLGRKTYCIETTAMEHSLDVTDRAGVAGAADGRPAPHSSTMTGTENST